MAQFLIEVATSKLSSVRSEKKHLGCHSGVSVPTAKHRKNQTQQNFFEIPRPGAQLSLKMPPVASDEGNLQNKLKYYFWANLQFKSIPRVLLSSPKNGKIFHLIQECAQLLNDMSAIFF